MENLIITGQITATSSKKDDKFKQENPTKTAYVTVTKKEDVEALEAFGATKYTTKEDNRDFFILKVPQSFVVVKGNEMKRLDGTLSSPNFRTKEDKEFKLNVIKSEKMGNEFLRLQAVQVDDFKELELIQMSNPFSSGALVEVEEDNNEFSEVNEDDLPF